ncbi:hypothetical protein CXG81DRAFT_19529 [Caulochytrium protostelioides]|uniref:Uncharacterized protein n=1 Tax=Caulochytrium protostelioides TaxID=1555241 RepID=A0A4P9X5V2_9FUNG|nr:hypothetical protein CXG81DRAFT_19529 [Caulochytrium protostelioides]|eukprot:RKP00534.1 hypothetical protein CXG81DRAFT_19529 [Caulochytrium protostelioides]
MVSHDDTAPSATIPEHQVSQEQQKGRVLPPSTTACLRVTEAPVRYHDAGRLLTPPLPGSAAIKRLLATPTMPSLSPSPASPPPPSPPSRPPPPAAFPDETMPGTFMSMPRGGRPRPPPPPRGAPSGVAPAFIDAIDNPVVAADPVDAVDAAAAWTPWRALQHLVARGARRFLLSPLGMKFVVTCVAPTATETLALLVASARADPAPFRAAVADLDPDAVAAYLNAQITPLAKLLQTIAHERADATGTADTSQADTSQADTSQADTSQADTSQADTSQAGMAHAEKAHTATAHTATAHTVTAHTETAQVNGWGLAREKMTTTMVALLNDPAFHANMAIVGPVVAPVVAQHVCAVVADPSHYVAPFRDVDLSALDRYIAQYVVLPAAEAIRQQRGSRPSSPREGEGPLPGETAADAAHEPDDLEEIELIIPGSPAIPAAMPPPTPPLRRPSRDSPTVLVPPPTPPRPAETPFDPFQPPLSAVSAVTVSTAATGTATYASSPRDSESASAPQIVVTPSDTHGRDASQRASFESGFDLAAAESSAVAVWFRFFFDTLYPTTTWRTLVQFLAEDAVPLARSVVETLVQQQVLLYRRLKRIHPDTVERAVVSMVTEAHRLAAAFNKDMATWEGRRTYNRGIQNSIALMNYFRVPIARAWMADRAAFVDISKALSSFVYDFTKFVVDTPEANAALNASKPLGWVTSRFVGTLQAAIPTYAAVGTVVCARLGTQAGFAFIGHSTVHALADASQVFRATRSETVLDAKAMYETAKKLELGPDDVGHNVPVPTKSGSFRSRLTRKRGSFDTAATAAAALAATAATAAAARSGPGSPRLLASPAASTNSLAAPAAAAAGDESPSPTGRHAGESRRSRFLGLGRRASRSEVPPAPSPSSGPSPGPLPPRMSLSASTSDVDSLRQLHDRRSDDVTDRLTPRPGQTWPVPGHP